MNEFLNFNSALLILILIVVVPIVFFLKNPRSKKNALLVLVLAVSISGVYSLLNTNDSSISSINQLEVAIEKNKPSVVYLYSDNWVICLSAKFVVDDLEADFDQKNQLFFRFNVRSKEGIRVFRDYEILGTPTILILDGSGKIMYKSYGFPKKNEILSTYENSFN